MWRFNEPAITIDGTAYVNSETYYHHQKPVPFDHGAWENQKIGVMRRGVRAKFAASKEARQLLMATHPHRLLSLKRDCFWGFDPERGGENMLARLLEELREELVSEAAGGSAGEEVAVILIGPPERVAAAKEQLTPLLLPYMPPVVQQKLAVANEHDAAEVLGKVLRCATHASYDDLFVSIHGKQHTWEAVMQMERSGELVHVLTARPLWAGIDALNGDAAPSHSVIQSEPGAVVAALSSRAPPIPVSVQYRDQTYAVDILPTLTGLMLKSKVISELGLEGGFQDFYLRLEGTPFGSRTPLAMHPHFKRNCCLIIEDVGARPKAMGMT